MAKKDRRPARRVTTTAVQSGETPMGKTTVGAQKEFNPDYSYVIKDLKRIGALAGTFFAVLIALSFILR